MSTENNKTRHCQFTEKWVFKVDKEKFTVENSKITGREILIKAGKLKVEQHLLILSGKGHLREITLDEIVDLSEPGVEKFRTIPRECREGFKGRCNFQLPDEDVSFLNALGCRWETVTEGGVMRLIIYGYKIVSGFNISQIDLYLRIEPTYPDTQIDMAYVYPALILQSGLTINALSNENFDGKIWQRWSRHRLSPTDWRQGIDCVETHLNLVNSWFAKEAGRGV